MYKLLLPAFLLLSSSVLAEPMTSHDQLHDLSDPDHWYDPWCCNLKDCAPIPDHAVTATDDGWLIQLQPGEHPMITEGTGPFSFVAPYMESGQTKSYGMTRRSKDEQFHACILHWMAEPSPRCFYRPEMGF
jgi:hypothetical protein